MNDSVYRYWREVDARHYIGANHPRDPKGQWDEKGFGGVNGPDPVPARPTGKTGSGPDAPTDPPKRLTTQQLRLKADTKLPGRKLPRNAPDSVPNTPLEGRDREVVMDYAWSPAKFERMNSTLRGKPDREVDPDTVRDIEELTEVLNKHKLARPLRVYRGTTREGGESWAQTTGRSGDGLMTDHGFASTSIDEDEARMMADPMDEGEGSMFVIDLPAGTKSVAIGNQFDDDGGYDQGEVLLQRGSRFEMVGQYVQDGMVYRHLVLKEQP